VAVLIQLLALIGAFALGLWYRDFALPRLVDLGLRPLAVALPGVISGVLVLALR
jgi:hypothetical protein